LAGEFEISPQAIHGYWQPTSRTAKMAMLAKVSNIITPIKSKAAIRIVLSLVFA
jgi:hypothetical protein